MMTWKMGFTIRGVLNDSKSERGAIPAGYQPLVFEPPDVIDGMFS